MRTVEDRVVQTHLEIDVRCGEHRQQIEILRRIHLIDQQPHLDAAPRGRQQFVEYQIAAIVLAVDIGLQVDAAARAADQVDAREQCIVATLNHLHVVALGGCRRFA